MKVHEDISAFKLFLLDCGLLGAMSKTPPALLLLPNNENTGKGDFTENFVCSQLQTLNDISIHYYSKENSQLELDFVIQLGSDIIPIEVKAEEITESFLAGAFVRILTVEIKQIHNVSFHV